MKILNCPFITSYERDIETELDFAQARYFSYNHGRFSSPDPYNIIFEKERGRNKREKYEIFNDFLSQPQNWNRYVYVVNNPTRFVDPTGLTYLEKDGKYYYIDDKDYKKNEKYYKDNNYNVIPDGSVVNIAAGGTGVFKGKEGVVILGAGGDVQPYKIDEYQVTSLSAEESDAIEAENTDLSKNTIWFEHVPPMIASGYLRICNYRSCDERVNELFPANGCFEDTLEITDKISGGGYNLNNGVCYGGYRLVNQRVPSWFSPGTKCVKVSAESDFLDFNPCKRFRP